jgi:hypothetical protein
MEEVRSSQRPCQIRSTPGKKRNVVRQREVRRQGIFKAGKQTTENGFFRPIKMEASTADWLVG